MFRKGDIAVRMVPSQEGGIAVGTRCIVKRVLNDREFTLEGMPGIYLQSSFQLDTEGENRQVSDLEQLEQALNILDHWNRTHPTALMVSVEAYPAQDGGSLFTTHGFDSNSIGELMGHLLAQGSNEAKAAFLERAAQALRFGA